MSFVSLCHRDNEGKRIHDTNKDKQFPILPLPMVADHKMAQILTPICHVVWAEQRQTPLIARRDTMKQPWREPNALTISLSDPTLDTLISRDGVYKDRAASGD